MGFFSAVAVPFFAAAVAIYIALMFISLVKVFTVRQKTISLIICTIFSILMLIGVITASISSIDFLF